MKFAHIKTQVFFVDKETGDHWTVTFKGKRGNEKDPARSIVYKNDTHIASYETKFGHANKTRAMHVIELAMEKDKK